MERPTGIGSGPGLRAYYVAVGSTDAKVDTLVELLQALRADAKLAVAVACSSRDSLDAVVAAMARSGGFNMTVLHADMEPHDLQQQVLQLKRALQSIPHPPSDGCQHHCVPSAQQQPGQLQPQLQPEPPQQPQPQHLHQQQQVQLPPLQPELSDTQLDGRSVALVTTDICLKVLQRELLPLGPSLLIQFDLPTTKEALQRRLATVFGSSKERSRRSGRLVVIDFVVAGQLAAFRQREHMSSVAVHEMPVHVPDVFG